MSNPTYSRMFAGMVKRLGGVEAAAAVIEAHTGACSKGTVSKQCSGQASVSVDSMVAIEDALRSFPFTNHLFERVGAGGVTGQPLQTLASAASIECGEALGALIRGFGAHSPEGSDLSAEERAEIVVEVTEARDALNAILAELA